MFSRVLVGVALFMGGAAPAFAGYVPVNACYSEGNWLSPAALASDGVLDSYSLAHLKYQGVLHDFYCVVPSSTSTSVIRLVGYTNQSFNFRITLRYADGVDTSSVFTSTANTVTTWYYAPGPGRINAVLRASDAIKVSIESPAPDNSYLYVGDVQVSTPWSSIDAIITPEIIGDLLQNTTFQAIVTAPQSIADFLNFENRSGGIHSWIWGFIFMSTFFVGMIFGARL